MESYRWSKRIIDWRPREDRRRLRGRPPARWVDDDVTHFADNEAQATGFGVDKYGLTR